MKCLESGNRQCTKCKGIYPLEFFGSTGNVGAMHCSKRGICKGCRQTEKDEKKEQNRFLVKARNTIRNHAKKYRFKPKEFIEKFGWDEKKLARDFEAAKECKECGKKYESMAHGLADKTLDIIEPNNDPYPHNSRIICMTCNREKSKYSSDVWGIIKRGWRLWEERKSVREKFKKPIQQTLF